MRVLHVEAGKHLYGGARQVLYLIEGLSARGIHNTLVCPSGSDIESAASALVDDLLPLPMRGDTDLAFIWQLRRIIRQQKPDVVHLHSRRGADLLGGLAAKLENTRCILSRRVDNAEAPWWVAIKYRLYDKVIGISEAIRHILVEEGVPSRKVTCVRSAVDPALYSGSCDKEAFHNAFDLKPDSLVVGVIAQLIPRKGHRYLLEVTPALKKSFPKLRIVFFGKGPLRKTLEQQVVDLGIADSVTIAGFREDLVRWLPCLDLVVHPADMEGLGLSLVQASAAGIPIVACRAGGIPEIVRHQQNGLLITPGDSQQLRNAIASLLSDREWRRQMGHEGKRLVTDEFSVNAMVDGNLAVYQGLLGAKK